MYINKSDSFNFNNFDSLFTLLYFHLICLDPLMYIAIFY